MNKFATNLKTLRKNRGWKQADMEAHGFARTRWSSYEIGVAEPSITDLIKIAKIFHVTETELIHSTIEEGYTKSKWAERKIAGLTISGNRNEDVKMLEQAISFLKSEFAAESDYQASITDMQKRKERVRQMRRELRKATWREMRKSDKILYVVVIIAITVFWLYILLL